MIYKKLLCLSISSCTLLVGCNLSKNNNASNDNHLVMIGQEIQYDSFCNLFNDAYEKSGFKYKPGQALGPLVKTSDYYNIIFSSTSDVVKSNSHHKSSTLKKSNNNQVIEEKTIYVEENSSLNAETGYLYRSKSQTKYDGVFQVKDNQLYEADIINHSVWKTDLKIKPTEEDNPLDCYLYNMIDNSFNITNPSDSTRYFYENNTFSTKSVFNTKESENIIEQQVIFDFENKIYTLKYYFMSHEKKNNRHEERIDNTTFSFGDNDICTIDLTEYGLE